MDASIPEPGAGLSVWMNGRILPAGESGLALVGDGLLGGWGVFETLGTRGGVPFAFSRHWQRLEAGARVCGIPLPDRAEVLAGLCELVETNGLVEARLRITLSAAMPLVADQVPSSAPVCLLQANEPPTGRRELGVIALPRWRYAGDPLGAIKSVSYADNLLALRRAHQAGAGEALLGNERDELCEAATANVWVVCGGKLRTPPLASGCLPGVARAILLEECQQSGIPVCEEPIPFAVLGEVEECFLTSSLRGVRPVTRIDGRSMSGHGMAERMQQIWEGLAVDV